MNRTSQPTPKKESAASSAVWSAAAATIIIVVVSQRTHIHYFPSQQALPSSVFLMVLVASASAAAAAVVGLLPVVSLLLVVICSLSGALSQNDGHCEGLSSDTRVVSTAAEAATLGEDLVLCPGLDFDVYWRGPILLDAGTAGVASFELTNSTTLRVSGDGTKTSVVDRGGGGTIFLVSELSVLHLEGLGLTGGDGENGGVVAAIGGASVTLLDCDVYGNRASSDGGRCSVLTLQVPLRLTV